MDKLPEYKFVESLVVGHDTCPIEILSGKFKGIIYKYGQISLNEIDDGQLQVNMNIEIIKAPDEFDQQEKEFTQTIGEIFVDVVESGVVNKEPVDLEADVHEDPVDID